MKHNFLKQFDCQIFSSCPTLHTQFIFLLLWKPSISWSRIFISKRKFYSLVVVQIHVVHSFNIMLHPCPHQYVAYWFCFQRRFVGEPLAAWPGYWRCPGSSHGHTEPSECLEAGQSLPTAHHSPWNAHSLCPEDPPWLQHQLQCLKGVWGMTYSGSTHATRNKRATWI